MHPEISHRNFAQDGAQPRRVVRIGVRQHYMLKHRKWPKLLLEVRDDVVSGFGMATVDQDQMIIGSVAITHYNGVTGFGAGANRQKLNLTMHLAPQALI
ncbi:hypothetical protein X772_29795 [Mesorhizobium sp. LSJC280B00]|nr:hypothetical protein X772_29795 [Mesorhizobium sp. LSJC280B00]